MVAESGADEGDGAPFLKLQRSRGTMTAEMSPTRRMLVDPIEELQRSRGTMTAEIACRKLKGKRTIPASTEPRHDDRGNMAAMGCKRGAARFNGAAAR